ncbi:hypothetical protein [Methylophilus luteus]|uniref:Uncharacterized protein n=1 Tax=Methylophilus luteus TaxID=640108 RepID=A0ABW3F8T8_9PROT
MYKSNMKFKYLLTRLLWSLSALFLIFLSMFLISLSVVILTGVFAKNVHYDPNLKPANTDQKFIVVTSSTHMEDVIRKSDLETVQLPAKF